MYLHLYLYQYLGGNEDKWTSHCVQAGMVVGASDENGFRQFLEVATSSSSDRVIFLAFFHIQNMFPLLNKQDMDHILLKLSLSLVSGRDSRLATGGVKSENGSSQKLKCENVSCQNLKSENVSCCQKCKFAKSTP